MKIKVRPAVLFVGIPLLIGILFLFSGIKGIVERSMTVKNYAKTDGCLCDYEIYSTGGYDSLRRRHTNDTYRLIYCYDVGGREYRASTDIGTGVIPEMGSVKEIRYNPQNPADAFIMGPDSSAFKIFFGLLFSAVSSFFIWLFLPEKKKTKKKRKKPSIDTAGAVFGFAFLLFSYGMLYFITGRLSVAGIADFYRTSFIFPMVIPILMILAGGYLFIKSILVNHERAARVCMIAGLCLLLIMQFCEG